MSQYNRRSFLATTSCALAGMLGGAIPLRLTGQQLASPAEALFPEPIDVIDLVNLATSAIEAAKSAGASYADIRVGELHRLQLIKTSPESMPVLTVQFTYGLRVLVGGAWAFVHGTAPSVDAIRASAAEAVATSRGYARLVTTLTELTPVPSIQGVWETPFEVDPFKVPLREQSALLGAYMDATGRGRYGLPGAASFDWTTETRVFASSEGSLVTQKLRRSNPKVTVKAFCELDFVSLNVPSLGVASGGYEKVNQLNIQDDIKLTTEEAVRYASLPKRSLEVGRYPVAFDGEALAVLLGKTLGTALQLDRVLGDEADASGTSFVDPSLLGGTISSPLVTITANRKVGLGKSVKWDDEGIEPREFTVIRDGYLTDFFASRSNISTLKPWYDRQRYQLIPQGCVVAGEAGEPPMIRTPELTMSNSFDNTSLADLYKDIAHGLVVRAAPRPTLDHSCTSGNINFARWRDDHLLLEVRNGQIIGRIYRNGIQFNTRPFWKSIQAVGGIGTIRTSSFTVDKGQPWRSHLQTATAPAALVKEVNVMLTEANL